jgi:DNA helicase IV
MSRAPAVREFLELVWPVVRPADLLAELLGDPAALAAAADGVLTAEEQAAIAWPRPRRARSARWTPAETVLIDEVAGLVARPPGYVHIIVDEAQDLSPMQCRALARRSEHGSLTVLGDLAQATTPWAATDWASQLTHLGQPKATLTALTAGFRIPAVVAALANRVLDALAVPVPPIHSVRADGELRVRPATDLVESTVEAVRAALGHEGSIAVIAADARTDTLAAALTRAGIAVSRVDGVDSVDAVGRMARVTALPASLAKGLEYDHVVVVEPAEIVAAEARGLHRLYVVLTRAVSRLDLVHREPLPPALRGADRLSAGWSGGTAPAAPPRPPSPRW